MPGCVLVIGRHDDVLLRRAYGLRSIEPTRTPMTPDTVFDLASLTKPVATATSIMILVERGKVDLAAPASRYVPELGKLAPFTVEQLLVHTSGLPAATPVSDYALDRPALMRRLGELTLKSSPGERFLYTDVGFVVLEEIVRRRGGKDLAAFAHDEIFGPLGMSETGFLPGPDLRLRAAPTEQRDGAWMIGDVHDPRAHALGGVAGHAGVFTTADDMARFARAMLNRGALDGKRILRERTFDVMTTRHETTSGGRALGWDRDSRFASHRGARLSAKAFGHGGFTGTAMWIDPAKDLYVVFLSNRVHPDGKGAVNPLVADLTSRAVDVAEVETGIDVLRGEGFARLHGAKVGLLTNASARAKDGTTTIDVLRSAPGVTLAAVFSPEHGLSASKEGKIGDTSVSGVPVYSLYGERSSPSSATLGDIDTIVVDLQDAGTRFYTYASTMKLAMKVASDRGLRFVVLDRPNPIGGATVEGPVLETRAGNSFVNHHALPVRHGMTMGELAGLFRSDEQLDSLRLDVVTMNGWRRGDYFDRTGLTWVSPSPNLRTIDGVVLYPMIGLLEATNLSVGRGTPTPFEIVGAPFIDGATLAKRLTERGVAGLAVEATTFTPSSTVHAGKKCGGLKLKVTDRAKFSPVRAALTLAIVLKELYPSEWESGRVDSLLQSKTAMRALDEGKTEDAIQATWSAPLATFLTKRERFLLYR